MKATTKQKQDMKKLFRGGKKKTQIAAELGVPYAVVVKNTPKTWRRKKKAAPLVTKKPKSDFRATVRHIMATEASDTNKLLAIDLLI